MALLVNISTTGKWSGRRVIKNATRRFHYDGPQGKRRYYYRVELMDGKMITVDHVEIIAKIEDKEKK